MTERDIRRLLELVERQQQSIDRVIETNRKLGEALEKMQKLLEDDSNERTDSRATPGATVVQPIDRH
jgi:hypothetical protein